MINAHRCCLIPDAQVGNEEWQYTSRHLAQALPLDIFLIVPAPAHGSMAITDMHGTWPRNHSFAKRAGTAQHQVIPAQIEAFHSIRIEWQKWLMMLLHQGQLLHKRGANIYRAKSRVNAPGIINRGIQWRVREKFVQRQYDALRPSHLIEVIMNQSHFHRNALLICSPAE